MYVGEIKKFRTKVKGDDLLCGTDFFAKLSKFSIRDTSWTAIILVFSLNS